MMHQNLSMSVNVRPADLIDALRRNKAAHLEEYARAVKVYLADLRTKFAELTERAEEADLTVDYNVHLIKPVDNTKLYDKYIGMFTLATDDVIEINTEDYGCVVDDNWDWAVAGKASNMFYSSRSR